MFKNLCSDTKLRDCCVHLFGPELKKLKKLVFRHKTHVHRRVRLVQVGTPNIKLVLTFLLDSSRMYPYCVVRSSVLFLKIIRARTSIDIKVEDLLPSAR